MASEVQVTELTKGISNFASEFYQVISQFLMWKKKMEKPNNCLQNVCRRC